jgi:hypothetical protein
MKTKNETDNQSPWPACAECQIGEVEQPYTAQAYQSPPDTCATGDGDDGWEQLEVSADLGPRRDEVRQQARDAFARALERARARIEPGK